MGMLKLLLVLLCLLPACSGRRLKRCEVVRIFKEEGLEGFEGFSLGNYVCMAFWESKWKTHKVREADVGKDYGIFQINSFKWCDDGTPNGKNQCEVPCGDLLKDDLKASIKCAKTIVKAEGLKSWDTWEKFCSERKVTRWTNGCEE